MIKLSNRQTCSTAEFPSSGREDTRSWSFPTVIFRASFVLTNASLELFSISAPSYTKTASRTLCAPEVSSCLDRLRKKWSPRLPWPRWCRSHFPPHSFLRSRPHFLRRINETLPFLARSFHTGIGHQTCHNLILRDAGNTEHHLLVSNQLVRNVVRIPFQRNQLLPRMDIPTTLLYPCTWQQ